MRNSLQAILPALLLAVAPAAATQAQTIVNDAFTGTNGASITGHTPDTDLPGATYVSGTGFGAPAPSFSTATGTFVSTPSSLSLNGDAYAELAITSNGSYTRPTGNVTLSANLQLGALTGNTANRGLMLGFAGTQTTGNGAGGSPIDSSGTFAGLIFSANTNTPGAVYLETPGATSGQTQLSTFNAMTLGAFNATSFYKLTYTINLSTGILSNITLSDATGTQAITAPGTNAFAGTTTVAPNNLAVFGSSASFTAGYVDDVTLAVPEPSTYAMLGVAGLALGLVVKRRASLAN